LYSQQLTVQTNLKNRQEQTGMRDILQPGDIPPLGNNASPKTNILPLSARPVVSSHLMRSPDEDRGNSFNIFLTSSAHEPSHSQSHSDPHLFPPVPCKISSQSLQKQIEHRVLKQTTRLMRIGDALVLIKDRSCAQRYISITPATKKITSIQATILVQALIRGALIRWRLRRKNRALAKMQSILLLQKYGRRYINKIRQARKRREFRMSCLILRKSINRRYRAAVIIQNFMKYALFLVHRQDYLRKYNSIKLHSKYQTYLQSATTIQRIFRGYKQRNDFMKWSATMRLLASSSHSRPTLRNKLKYNFISASHSNRTLHYTVAGSGGFQFKFRKKENNNRLPGLVSGSGKESDTRDRKASSSSNLDPKLMTLILTQSELFQTLLVGENAGIEMVHQGQGVGGDAPESQIGGTETGEVTGEMRLFPLLSEEVNSSNDEDFSFQSTPVSSPHGQYDPMSPGFESTPPGTAAGTGTSRKPQPQRALSRQNTFGTSIISSKALKRLASNGERSFIQDHHTQSDPGFDRRGGGGEQMGQTGHRLGEDERQKVEEMKRRMSARMKSTNDAYVSPSVHNKSVFKRRKDSLKQSDQQNSDGLKHMLKSVYG
jgi:hypothetical protein